MTIVDKAHEGQLLQSQDQVIFLFSAWETSWRSICSTLQGAGVVQTQLLCTATEFEAPLNIRHKSRLLCRKNDNRRPQVALLHTSDQR